LNGIDKRRRRCSQCFNRLSLEVCDYFLFPFRVWESALAATDLQVFEAFLLVRTFAALEATFFEVCFLFGMILPFFVDL